MHSGSHCCGASEPISVRSSTNSSQSWDQRQSSLNYLKLKFSTSSSKTKWLFQRSLLTISRCSNLKRCYLPML